MPSCCGFPQALRIPLRHVSGLSHLFKRPPLVQRPAAKSGNACDLARSRVHVFFNHDNAVQG